MIASRSPVGDGGFPGLAAFSLLGFAVVLGLIALLGLKPWGTDSVEPRLELPALEAEVGEAIALPSEWRAFVADATVAPLGAERVEAAAERASEAEGPSVVLAVGPARMVAVAGAPSVPGVPEPEAGDEVPSVGTDGEAPPEGTSSPVSTPESPDGAGPGPVPSREPVLESCEGDEYVITIVLAPDVEGGEEASVEIVLQRFNEDGSVDELQLEGNEFDAEALALQLSSEGSCVYIEADDLAEEGVPSSIPPSP